MPALNTEPDKLIEESKVILVEWRPIFDGIFEVSSNGQVRRVLAPYGRTRPGLLKQCTTKYSCVDISISGVSKTYAVHRLVLLAFRGPCPEGMESAHLNGNKMDNRIENLAYATRKENMAHKRLHGTWQIGEKGPSATLTNEAVRVIKRELAAGTRGADLARRFNVTDTAISCIKRGVTWRYVQFGDEHDA